jgi:3-phenylpropionate/trans-cinnamate dioxygenase ferredoxin reductase component
MAEGNGGMVIVGASLAGAKAAQALREEGFAGSITLIGDETERPYERPPLSKDYLQGSSARDNVFVHPEGWYAENDVDLRLCTTVTGIDRDAHEVVVSGGERLGYGTLLLATGSTPRHLRVPGADLEGVLYLRRLEDSERIKAAFGEASRVAIIGAGWIGLETAAAARAAGLDVTVLEYADLPLARVLGPEVAQVFSDLHRDNGVDMRCGVEVAAIIGAEGAVTGVQLGDGVEVPGDLVLVGVGITPNIALAADAGLDVGNGITVDEHLRTSDRDIYAAGDVADAYHPRLRQHVRVEHWANARRQGVIAAKSMLGRDAAYDRLPYFFSDQYDLGMEYTGHVGPDGYDRVVFRGSPGKREFLAFWLADGKVLAGMNANVWDVTEQIEALILSGRRVDVDRLADAEVPLDQL